MSLDIEETFRKFKDEYLKFERIENPITQQPDLCAFIFLSKLILKNKNMISCAEHDKIFLNITESDLHSVTESIVIHLLRCGILYDSDHECLFKFV
jgi:hypothetical protein